MYPVYFRDTYARVQTTPIQNMVGVENENTAVKAVNMEWGGSSLFLKGNNMFGYLHRNIRDHCKSVITLVVPGLRNLYWQGRSKIPEEFTQLDNAISQPLPNFVNVYDFPKLENFKNLANYYEYQLNGVITPYDVVHFYVPTFVAAINDFNRIYTTLGGIDIVLEFNYTIEDLFDRQYQRPIQYVDIEGACH